MKTINLFFIILFLTSCTFFKPVPAEEISPVILIENVKREKIIKTLNEQMVKQDYRIITVNEDNASYIKIIENFNRADIYDLPVKANSVIRINFFFEEVYNGIKIEGSIELVTNQGSNTEQIRNLTLDKKYADRVRFRLEEVKSALNR